MNSESGHDSGGVPSLAGAILRKLLVAAGDPNRKTRVSAQVVKPSQCCFRPCLDGAKKMTRGAKNTPLERYSSVLVPSDGPQPPTTSKGAFDMNYFPRVADFA
jgi:hypothetical protein